MLVIQILIIVSAAAGIYQTGKYIGRKGDPTNTNVGTNDREITECQVLCNQVYLRRLDIHNAEVAKTAAKERLASAEKESAIAAGTAVAISAVAALMAAIPLVGEGIITALLAVSAIMLTRAIYIVGAKDAAEADLAKKNKILQDANDSRHAAVNSLFCKCPDWDGLDPCLKRAP